MQITYLGLTGFGGRTGLELVDLAPGVNVIHGRNEAGKTTLMEAVRAALFGFLDRRKANRNRYELPDGAARQLRLDIRVEGGRLWRLDRSEGKQGLQIVDQDGVSIPESRLHHALLHTERSLYESIFAFSISELSDLGTLDASVIQDRLLGAALGAGTISPGAALKKLEARRDDLFKPRKTNCKVAAARRELDEMRKRVNILRVMPRDHDELVERLYNSIKQRAELRKNQSEVERELGAVQRLISLKKKWEAMQSAELEAAGLKHAVNIPLDAVAKLEVILEEERLAKKRVDEQQQILIKLEAALDALATDPNLGPFLSRLDEFYSEHSSQVHFPEEMKKRLKDLKDEENKAERQRLACGPEWDNNRALLVPATSALRRDVMQRLEWIGDIRQDQKHAVDRLTETEEREKDVLGRLQTAEQQLSQLEYLADLPRDAIASVTRFQTRIAEIEAEESRGREDSSQAYKHAESIEVDKTLASRTHEIEAVLAQFTANRDLSERLEIQRDAVRKSAQFVQEKLNRCGVNKESAHKLGEDAQIHAQLAAWRDRWTGNSTKGNATADQLLEAEQRLNNAEESYRQLVISGSESNNKLEEIIDPDQRYIKNLSGFQEFERLMHHLDKARLDLADSQSKYNQRIDETKRYIADLGAAWSEERVRGVSTTSGTAQAVQSWTNQLDVAKQAKQRAEDDLDQSVQEADSNRIELADLEKRGFNIENRAKPNHVIVKLLRDWLKVHERLAENLERRDIARVLYENEHGVSADSGTLSVLPMWVFALLGLLVLVVGSLFVISSDFIAAMAVTILGCPAVILLWLQKNRTLAQIETEKRAASRRKKQLDDELKKQQNRVEELERELQRLSSRLPDEITGKKEEVADYLDSIETAIDDFMNNQQETEQWLALRNQVQRDQQVLASKKNLLAKKTREYEDLDHRWEEWSRSNGFESSCTPYEIAMLLIDLRDARAHLQETDHAEKKYEKAQHLVQEAENNLAELFDEQGYPQNTDEDSLAKVKKAWEQSLQQLNQITDVANRLQDARAEVDTLKKNQETFLENRKSMVDEWRKWLEEQQLPYDENPGDAEERLRHIRKAHADLSRHERDCYELENLEKHWHHLLKGLPDSIKSKSNKDWTIAKAIDVVRKEQKLCQDAYTAGCERDEWLRKAGEAEERAKDAKQRRENVIKQLESQIAQYGFGSVKDFFAAQEDVKERADLFGEQKRLKRELESVTIRISELQHAASEAKNKTKKAKEELDQFLVRHNLPSNLDGDSLVNLIESLIEYHQTLSSIERTGKAYERIQRRWEKMVERFLPLLKAVGIASDIENAELSHVITRIHKAVDKLAIERETVEKRRQTRDEQNKAEKALIKARNEYNKRIAALQTLLHNAGAETQNIFRQWNRDAERMRELQRTIDKEEAALMTALQEADKKRLYKRFSNTDWDQENFKEKQLVLERKKLESELSELEQGIGADEQKRREYEQSEEQAACRQDEAVALARIESAAEEWVEWAVAVMLVEQARERFERERQPEVLKAASEYFALLTGNAYAGIRVRLGERNLHAVRADGTHLPLLHLSRGTVEPLYLALRLALIADYSRSPGGAPPVLMDDILVNFDDKRSHYAAEAINRLGQDTQVLLLTCHERTIECFNKSNVHVIRLD